MFKDIHFNYLILIQIMIKIKLPCPYNIIFTFDNSTVSGLYEGKTPYVENEKEKKRHT